MNRFLITGATGFVGRHLCKRLLDQGHAVRAAVRRVPCGSLPTRVETIEISEVGPSTDWSAALEAVDIVIHLAGIAHKLGTSSAGAGPELFRVNSQGTAKLAADMAAGGRRQRLVFLSSVGAMATSSSTALTEESPCRPTSDYGRSKLRGEIELEAALAGSTTDWCIVRAPLVYGPGNPGNMARLQNLIRLGLPLPFASIANRRSFIYVGNLTDVLVRCALHPNASRQVFLVSDSHDFSTPDLVRTLAKSWGRRAILFPMPRGPLQLAGRLGDWVREWFGLTPGLDTHAIDRLWGSLVIDSSKVVELLDWKPPSDVQSGLSETFRDSAKGDHAGSENLTAVISKDK